ncbi:hypothetical protein, partial [[Clostridium] symbiosum]
CRQGWRTLPVSKYICNLQGSFTPGSPAIGFHKSLDTTTFMIKLLYQFYHGTTRKSDGILLLESNFIIIK